jgi:phosphonoacetaldehyde hydrolase
LTAGAFTVGVTSGNAIGVSFEVLQALAPTEHASRVAAARQSLLGAGADVVIDSVADLLPALERATR